MDNIGRHALIALGFIAAIGLLNVASTLSKTHDGDHQQIQGVFCSTPQQLERYVTLATEHRSTQHGLRAVTRLRCLHHVALFCFSGRGPPLTIARARTCHSSAAAMAKAPSNPNADRCR
jgi:hypothetical protein